MPEAEDVFAGGARPADVVDLDRAVLGQGRRVDEHDRDVGATDLLDLRVPVRQADRDDPVDGGAAHGPGQAAVQRRDEVEAVPVLLGGQRDALAEGAEERVAEDHAEGLRGEHADRHRLALGEHPRDRVRAIAEVLRDLADPERRLGRQPVRRVERERHGRLADARLAGDVGDARSLGPLLHSGPTPPRGDAAAASPPEPV